MERRVSDEVTRWYVHDKILRYLGISHETAIVVANDRNYGESSKTRNHRKTIEASTPYKDFKEKDLKPGNMEVF